MFEHKRNWLYNLVHNIPMAHLEYVHSPLEVQLAEVLTPEHFYLKPVVMKQAP